MCLFLSNQFLRRSLSRLQLLREGIVNGEPEGLLQELTLGGELLLIAARVARRLVEVGIKEHIIKLITYSVSDEIYVIGISQ